MCPQGGEQMPTGVHVKYQGLCLFTFSLVSVSWLHLPFHFSPFSLGKILTSGSLSSYSGLILSPAWFFGGDFRKYRHIQV